MSKPTMRVTTHDLATAAYVTVSSQLQKLMQNIQYLCMPDIHFILTQLGATFQSMTFDLGLSGIRLHSPQDPAS